MAPTSWALKSGRISSKRLPAVRAMYSVQTTGRPKAFMAAIRFSASARVW